MNRVPEDIIQRAGGSAAWEALSFALQNMWVQDIKHLVSEKVGYDVGVPFITHLLFGPLDEDYYMCPYMKVSLHIRTDINFRAMRSRINASNVDAFSRLVAEAYLLGTDFRDTFNVRQRNGLVECTGIVPDNHGGNQLEGELRRYGAAIRHVDDPAKVDIGYSLIHTYCQVYRLGCQDEFAKRLGIEQLVVPFTSSSPELLPLQSGVSRA